MPSPPPSPGRRPGAPGPAAHAVTAVLAVLAVGAVCLAAQLGSSTLRTTPAGARMVAATAASAPSAGAAAAPSSGAGTGSTASGATAPTATAPTAAAPTATAAATRAAARSDDLTARGLPSRVAWRNAVRRTRRWAAARGARIRFALRVEDRDWSFRGSETTHSNSLVKATVLVAYLRRSSVRGRALTAAEKALLEPMIRESANGPVSTLISTMGGVEPLRNVGRLVGMRHFAPVAGLWGTSSIAATDEVRLFSRLERALPARHRAYALRLLRTIVPAQRWGMPQAAPAGWRVAFKSGWSGRGRVVQAMTLDCHGRRVTASVLVDGAGQESSIALVEAAGRRLLAPLRVRGSRACSSVVG